MKIIRFVLSLFFLSIGIFGCQHNSEVKVDNPKVNSESLEKITFYPKESNSETLVIEDRETIEIIKKAVDNAEKQPGIVNMADPEFRIAIGEETYFLWIDETAGAVMNTENTHTIYSLTYTSVNQINEIISYNYLNFKEIAWNFLIEHGWNESAKEGWKSTSVTKIIVNEDYVLLDKSFDGKEVLAVSFKDKKNVIVGTPIVLIDANTKKVIGYMPGE